MSEPTNQADVRTQPWYRRALDRIGVHSYHDVADLLSYLPVVGRLGGAINAVGYGVERKWRPALSAAMDMFARTKMVKLVFKVGRFAWQTRQQMRRRKSARKPHLRTSSSSPKKHNKKTPL